MWTRNRIRITFGIYKLKAFSYLQHAKRFAGSNSFKNFVLQSDHIAEAIKIQPKLALISSETWHRAHDTFTNHGLQTNSFLRIVCSNPAILTRPPRDIINSFEIWRSCQFGEKLQHLMLTKYPEFLDISDERQLLSQIVFIRGFVGSSKNVWKILMNSPDLLGQSTDKIESKFDYIQQCMRIDVPEIVKSAALSKSLRDIRCRHVFLERLGLFKRRSLKAAPNEPNKNHRLYQICDTSDKTFATKLCHVRLEEYETFQELYLREETKKQDAIDNETDGEMEDDCEA